MNEEHRKVIENTIQDSFKLKDRFHDFEANFSGQLLFEHLDLLKNLASIIIAVIGIGYLLGSVGINVFSTSALLFSIVSLIKDFMVHLPRHPQTLNKKLLKIWAPFSVWVTSG